MDCPSFVPAPPITQFQHDHYICVILGSSHVSRKCVQRTKGERKKEKGESKKEESSEIELTDEEKLVMKLLQEKSPVDLNELKGQTGLSGKKWDTAIKGLRKHNLAKVEKTDEGLWVSLV